MFLLGVFVLAGLVLFATSKSYVSFSLTTDKSTVQVGDTVTATATGSATVYQNMFCNNGTTSNNYCGARGGTGLCLSPCTAVSILDPFNSYGYQGVHFYYNDPVFGEGYVDSSYIYYSVGPDWSHSAVADILVTDGSSSFDGFFVGRGAQLTVSGRLSSVLYSQLALGGWTVGVCYDSSRTAPTVNVSGSPAAFSYFKTVSGTWFGRNWTCVVYRSNGNYTYEDFTINVTSNADTRLYFTFASACFYDNAYCPGTISENIRLELSSFSMSFDGYPGFYYFEIQPPSGFSLTSGSACTVTDGTGTQSFSATYSVTSSASPGSNTFRGIFATYAYYLFYLYPGSDTYSVSCGLFDVGDPGYLGSDTATVTVVTPATAVTLYNYGSNSGSPVQTPTDDSVQYRVYVSGGTAFDRVEVYVDGALKKTYYPSDVICGSTDCYVDDRIDLGAAADGTHTIDAKLYVNGSLQDTDSKTFTYYAPGIRNVSASYSSGTGSVSFEVKGGWRYYRIYIDSTTCVAKDWTSAGPTTASNWYAFGPVSFTWPSCANTSGTHTVYVEVKPDSGAPVVSDSSTVTVSFNYSLSNPQPPSGTRYYVQVQSKWQVPSTFSIPTSVQYSTDAPSATLTEYFAGNQVTSQTVSGSGTFTYTITGNQIGSNCGTSKEIKWTLGTATERTYVDIYCVYASILSPTGQVTLPTSDGSTVLPGTKLVVETEVSTNPSGATVTPTVTIDGQTGTITQCSTPDPTHYCFQFDASGWQCGSTKTVQLSADVDGQLTATAQSTFEVNCAQNYVSIVSPQDGVTIHTFQPINDTTVTLAVDYASSDPGAYLKVWFNGAYRDLSEAPTCSYKKCYVLDYANGLQLGPNEVRVELYNSSDQLVTDDNVIFYVNYWNPSVGEDWTATPPVFWVSDGGEPAHADRCTYEINGIGSGDMSFNNVTVRWELPIDENYIGVVVNYACYYGTDKVFDGNYTIQGPSESGAQPGSGTVAAGTGFAGLPAVSKTAFPVFPAYEQSGPYIYSVYHASGSSPTYVFKDVYVSNGRLCFVPRTSAKHHIVYYAADFTAFPTTDSEVDALIGSLGPEDVRSVQIEQEGSAYCFQLQGTALIKDEVSGTTSGEYWFIVLNTEQTTVGINMAFVGLIFLVLIGYILFSRSVRGGA